MYNDFMTEDIIIVDKPTGISSAKVVGLLKPAFKGQKIGHAGSLDPLASGVLIILVGKATKRFNDIQSLSKAYLADIVFGYTTDTLDLEGQISQSIKPEANLVKLSDLKQTLTNFPQTYQQTVPVYSASKYKGKPLYKWARQGLSEQVPIKTKEVIIYDLKLVRFYLDDKDYPHVIVKIKVGSGFYVRQFAQDLGQRLNLPACLAGLRRTAIGPYDLEEL